MQRIHRAIIALAIFSVAGGACAEVSEIKITKQPGALYMPVMLMEKHKILEKHAAAAGLGDLKVVLSGSSSLCVTAARCRWVSIVRSATGGTNEFASAP